jgi:ABC-2 type transport system permease protein
VNGFVTDTGAIMRREWLRYRRDRAYWVGQVAFPLLAVAFVGFGLNGVVHLPTGTDYLGHLASGMIALIVGSAGVGGGMTLIQDRESGFLRALLVAPVSGAAVVAGKILARVGASLLLVAVLVAVLAGFTPLRLVHAGATVLGVISITVVFVSLGVVLGAFLRSAESYRLLAAMVTVPLYFLSGIFYPVSTLPAPTRWLASANPLTYGVDLLRYGLLGVSEIPVGRSAVLLCVLTGVCAVAAVAAFQRSADA